MPRAWSILRRHRGGDKWEWKKASERCNSKKCCAAQKDHARQTLRFLIFGFEAEKGWTSRQARHVGSRNLDTVHTGGPSLVESTYS